MFFDTIVTKEVQVGPDPTVVMELESAGQDEDGSDKWMVSYTVDHDVEYFKYCLTDNVADLRIVGATQSMLKNPASSGIPYERWRDGIYEWVAEVGMETQFEYTAQEFVGDGPVVAACLAAGKDADGNPVYNLYHYIIREGKAQTLEEMFGITE